MMLCRNFMLVNIPGTTAKLRYNMSRMRTFTVTNKHPTRHDRTYQYGYQQPHYVLDVGHLPHTTNMSAPCQ